MGEKTADVKGRRLAALPFKGSPLKRGASSTVPRSGGWERRKKGREKSPAAGDSFQPQAFAAATSAARAASILSSKSGGLDMSRPQRDEI